MAAFEKVLSGIPQMDVAFDYIRPGDNVVWQVTNLQEFQCFVEPYIRQAIADDCNIIYIRFAEHAPLLAELPNRFIEFYPEGDDVADIVSFYDVTGREAYIYHDMHRERMLIIL